VQKFFVRVDAEMPFAKLFDICFGLRYSPTLYKWEKVTAVDTSDRDPKQLRQHMALWGNQEGHWQATRISRLIAEEKTLNRA
jgi:hypothetical protein